MSTRKKMRFLKRVLLWCLIMGTVLTLGVLVVAWHVMELPEGSVAALAALWSVELVLSAIIKNGDKKSADNDDTEGSI